MKLSLSVLVVWLYRRLPDLRGLSSVWMGTVFWLSLTSFPVLTHRKWWLCSEKDLEQQIKTLEDKLASMTLSEQEFQRQVVDLKAKLLFMEKTEHAAKLDVGFLIHTRT